MAPDGATRLAAWLRSLPASALAAFGAAALAAVLTFASPPSGLDGPLLGGLLAFVTPYLGAAIALGGRSVASKGIGVAIAAVAAWLTSFGVTELAAGLGATGVPRSTTLTFVALTIAGAAVTGLGLRDVARAAHADGYWARTPLDARLAFLAVAYWSLTFAADTYLTGSPPLGRMLMAPLLLMAHLGIALMLRAPLFAARVTGALAAAGAGVATAAFWVALAPYLTLTGGPPAVPYLGYWTSLPWPVLLAVALSLDAAIVAVSARHQLRWAARKLRTVRR